MRISILRIDSERGGDEVRVEEYGNLIFVGFYLYYFFLICEILFFLLLFKRLLRKRFVFESRVGRELW